ASRWIALFSNQLVHPVIGEALYCVLKFLVSLLQQGQSLVPPVLARIEQRGPVTFGWKLGDSGLKASRHRSLPRRQVERDFPDRVDGRMWSRCRDLCGHS